jgi:hypothetical protein
MIAHLRRNKESACGCAGIYTAHAAIELYAEVFEQEDALDRLEAFASFRGADFYGLPRNAEQITLVKKPRRAAETFDVEDDVIVPLRAGEPVAWQLMVEGHQALGSFLSSFVISLVNQAPPKPGDETPDCSRRRSSNRAIDLAQRSATLATAASTETSVSPTTTSPSLFRVTFRRHKTPVPSCGPSRSVRVNLATRILEPNRPSTY